MWFEDLCLINCLGTHMYFAWRDLYILRCVYFWGNFFCNIRVIWVNGYAFSIFILYHKCLYFSFFSGSTLCLILLTCTSVEWNIPEFSTFLHINVQLCLQEFITMLIYNVVDHFCASVMSVSYDSNAWLEIWELERSTMFLQTVT